MKRFRDLKIGAKLMVVFLGVGVSLTVMAGYLVIHFSSRYLINNVKERYREEAFDNIAAIDILMSERYYDIKAFAKNEILTRGTSSPKEITEFLKTVKEIYGYESLSYFDMNRIRIADTEGLNLGQQHYMVRCWEDVLMGEVSAGDDVRMSEDLNVPIVYFASQVKDIENKSIGVVVARYSLAKMDAVIERLVGVKLEATLIDKERNIIFTNHPELKDKVLKEKILELESVKAVLDGQDGAMLLYDPYCKKEFITAYSHEKGYGDFKGNDWSLLLSIEKDKALAPIRQLRNIIILVLIATVIGVFIAASLVTPVISGPITELKEIAQMVGKGDLTVRTSVDSKDEIGILAVSFNKMTEDLKSSRDEILKGKAYTDSVISSMIDTMIIISPDAKIKTINKATSELLGYTEEELIGKPVATIFAEEEEEEEEVLFKGTRLRRLIKEGEVRNFDMTYKTKSGEKIPVSFNGSVLREISCPRLDKPAADCPSFKEKGVHCEKIIGIVGVARDMRETLKLINDLEKSKMELQEWSKTLEKKISERTKDLEDEHEASLNILEDLQETKENLEISELKYRKIFESAQEGILSINAKTGEIISANQFLLDMFNYKSSEFLGKKFWEIGISRELLKFPQEGKTSPFGFTRHSDVQLKTKDGRDFIIDLIYSAYNVRNLDVVQCLVRNITGRKWVEEQITKLNKELQAKTVELDTTNKALKKTDELKDLFVSTVSHELRTPLAIMKEGISLVLDGLTGDINEKQRKMLTISKSNIDRLVFIVNNLLDIAKLEAKKMELKKESFDIKSIIKENVSQFEKIVKDKGLEIKTTLPGEDIIVYADENKINQALVNLLGNAVKFTEEGYIEVKVSQDEEEVICSVTDTGVGIKEEDIPKVFGKFQQFNRTAGSGYKGTGLGLAITKDIIELHNEKIWIESPPAGHVSKFGKGTRFSFTLPRYSSLLIFKEYINNGIKQASENKTKMSIILISMPDSDKQEKSLPAEKIDSILKNIEDIIKNNLRRSGDVVLKGTEEVVIMVDCKKEDALQVEKRLETAILDYLNKNGLKGKINLRFGCATYPDDGSNDAELVKKARG